MTTEAEKLAAGVSVDPVWYHKDLGDRAHKFYDQTETQPEGCTPLYTEAAIAAARVQALEEAAKVCDRTASDYKGMFAEDESLYIAATDCANEIRALIGKETP